MNSKLGYPGIIFLLLIIVVFLRCGKDSSKIESEQLKTLLNKNLPKDIEKEYNLVIRYESKDGPESWNKFNWKKDNDYLEKKGLLKQIISDTTLNFYDHKHLKFMNKHEYLYKAVMSSELKKLLTATQSRSERFDEYDKFNRKTGQMTSIFGNAICGSFQLEEINEIKQIDNSSSSEIKYEVKFHSTAFNDIINYDNKYQDGESFSHKAVVKKISPKDISLVNH